MTNHSRRRVCFALSLAAFSALPCAAQSSDRVNLFPRLQVGQIFRYRVGYRSETRANTESNVAAPMAPAGGRTDVQLYLVAEVTDLRLDAGRPIARIRTQIAERDAAAPAATPPPNAADAASTSKIVEFTLEADGSVSAPERLDKLTPGEQAAWQEWLSRFAAAAIYPEKGIKPGDKWKAEEAIPATILAGLSWEKASEYVHDEPCAAKQLAPQGARAPTAPRQETCAVILTTATLRQKSSAKDATPEDYKLHDLRTTGTASGKNEIVSYISLRNGVLVRASEDAHQTMNAAIAKVDGSNRVHYTIEAESHAQVLLVAAPASNLPQ